MVGCPLTPMVSEASAATQLPIPPSLFLCPRLFSSFPHPFPPLCLSVAASGDVIHDSIGSIDQDGSVNGGRRGADDRGINNNDEQGGGARDEREGDGLHDRLSGLSLGAASSPPPPSTAVVDDDDDIPDIDDVEGEELMMEAPEGEDEDEATLSTHPTSSTTTAGGVEKKSNTDYLKAVEPEDNIVKTSPQHPLNHHNNNTTHRDSDWIKVED
jgi:hypothetical protein